MVLDEDATQKYVLIEAYADGGSEGPTYLVRGSRHAKYHKDAAKETLEALEAAAVPHRVLGGGWLNHDVYLRTVDFYGASQGYPWEGAPRHDIAVERCAAALGPDFTVGIKDDEEAEAAGLAPAATSSSTAVFICDYSNHAIVRVESDGAATTIASGPPEVHYPDGLAWDAAGGRLYWSDLFPAPSAVTWRGVMNLAVGAGRTWGRRTRARRAAFTPRAPTALALRASCPPADRSVHQSSSCSIQHAASSTA